MDRAHIFTHVALPLISLVVLAILAFLIWAVRSGRAKDLLELEGWNGRILVASLMTLHVMPFVALPFLFFDGISAQALLGVAGFWALTHVVLTQKRAFEALKKPAYVITDVITYVTFTLVGLYFQSLWPSVFVALMVNVGYSWLMERRVEHAVLHD